MSVRTVSRPEVECGMTTASRATALCTAAGQMAARQLAGEMASRSLEELEGRRFSGEFICDFTTAPGASTDEPVTHMAFGFATQVVILAEDGTIEKVVAAHDVGRAINPQLCAGQIEGGVHMGLGYALSEDFPCTDGATRFPASSAISAFSAPRTHRPSRSSWSRYRTRSAATAQRVSARSASSPPPARSPPPSTPTTASAAPRSP